MTIEKGCIELKILKKNIEEDLQYLFIEIKKSWPDFTDPKSTFDEKTNFILICHFLSAWSQKSGYSKKVWAQKNICFLLKKNLS